MNKCMYIIKHVFLVNFILICNMFFIKSNKQCSSDDVNNIKNINTKYMLCMFMCNIGYKKGGGS